MPIAGSRLLFGGLYWDEPLTEAPGAHTGSRIALRSPRERYVTPPSRWTDPGPYGAVPLTEAQWEVLQGRYEREKEIVGMMAEAGVPILARSDATPRVFPGFSIHDELELLVEAGLTPLQAVQAAVLDPARFFDRTDELGTVEEGKLADLVLLEANPLEDIANTRRIRAAVAHGRLYRRADLDRLLAEVEASVEQTYKQE